MWPCRLTHFPNSRRFSSSDRRGSRSWCAALNDLAAADQHGQRAAHGLRSAATVSVRDGPDRAISSLQALRSARRQPDDAALVTMLSSTKQGRRFPRALTRPSLPRPLLSYHDSVRPSDPHPAICPHRAGQPAARGHSGGARRWHRTIMATACTDPAAGQCRRQRPGGANERENLGRTDGTAGFTSGRAVPQRLGFTTSSSFRKSSMVWTASRYPGMANGGSSPIPPGCADQRTAARCPCGRPAEQQPGPPPHRSSRTHTFGACHASPPRHQEQAIPLASLLRVVLHGLREVLVEGHGLPPGKRLCPAFAAGFWLSCCWSRKVAPRYIRGTAGSPLCGRWPGPAHTGVTVKQALAADPLQRQLELRCCRGSGLARTKQTRTTGRSRRSEAFSLLE